MQIGLNGSTSNAATLNATYPLSGCTVSVKLPPGGVPWEVPAIVCSALNCNVHYNLPMLASDSLVYSVARKALQYMVPGRKVYVELCDEPWNGVHAVTNQTTWLGRVQGQNNEYWWYGLRSGQVGNIFRSVFATAGRASEINMMVNGVNNAASIMEGVTSNNMVVQTYTINTYCGGDWQANTTGSGAAYVNSFLPQSGNNNPDLVPAICDYVYHNIRYNTTNGDTYVNTLAGQNAVMAQYNEYLQAYNATNGTNYPPLQLYGYEGDMAGACPSTCRRIRYIPAVTAWGIPGSAMLSIAMFFMTRSGGSTRRTCSHSSSRADLSMSLDTPTPSTGSITLPGIIMLGLASRPARETVRTAKPITVTVELSKACNTRSPSRPT